MSLFTRLFGRPKPEPISPQLTITGRPATFTRFSGDPWENDVYRSGVDAICRIASKFTLQPTITFSDGTKTNADDRLARLLQVEPNPLMSAYDFLYMLHAHLFTGNNAFCYVQRDQGKIVAFWPLHVTSCELAQGQGGRTLAALNFANGKSAILDYHDIVHLKRHLNTGEVMGDSNGPISAGVELAEAQNAGITASIKNAGRIRGIVTYAGSLGPSKLESYKKAFEESQLAPENTGGVVITDSGCTFTPINETSATINAQDMEETRKKLFSYLGISDSIVDSSFTDDTFAAFDESVLEGLALQEALEFTRKIYSASQVMRGRRIECNTSRIRFIGVKNRVDLISHATPMGVLSINETRDLLGLAPVEDGERFIQSLNYADVSLVNRYQLFNAGHGGVRTMGIPEEAKNDEEV